MSIVRYTTSAITRQWLAMWAVDQMLHSQHHDTRHGLLTGAVIPHHALADAKLAGRPALGIATVSDESAQCGGLLVLDRVKRVIETALGGLLRQVVAAVEILRAADIDDAPAPEITLGKHFRGVDFAAVDSAHDSGSREGLDRHEGGINVAQAGEKLGRLDRGSKDEGGLHAASLLDVFRLAVAGVADLLDARIKHLFQRLEHAFLALGRLDHLVGDIAHCLDLRLVVAAPVVAGDVESMRQALPNCKRYFRGTAQSPTCP